MSRKSITQVEAEPMGTDYSSGDSQAGQETPRPRPKRPYSPGPLISKPDETIKIAVPLPPDLKE